MPPPRPPLDVDALRTDLLGHARAIVAREGVDALTMRALAAEAGTSVGLSYRAFESRDEILRRLTREALAELAERLDAWANRPGGTLGDRLAEFADLLFGSPAPALVLHPLNAPASSDLLDEAVDAGVARSWALVMSEFLRARQLAGLVDADVDVEAFGFILTAAMHHVLLTEGPFPLPDRDTLVGYLRAVAQRLAPPVNPV